MGSLLCRTRQPGRSTSELDHAHSCSAAELQLDGAFREFDRQLHSRCRGRGQPVVDLVMAGSLGMHDGKQSFTLTRVFVCGLIASVRVSNVFASGPLETNTSRLVVIQTRESSLSNNQIWLLAMLRKIKELAMVVPVPQNRTSSYVSSPVDFITLSEVQTLNFIAPRDHAREQHRTAFFRKYHTVRNDSARGGRKTKFQTPACTRVQWRGRTNVCFEIGQ
jgi:hypothetical protein